MQSFVDRFRRGVTEFMRGRYGADQLGLALMVVGLLFSIISVWGGMWASIVSFLLLALVIYRMLSTNIEARQRENQMYVDAIAKPASFVHKRRVMWENRKTKAYVRCPNCKTQFALPKGKGRVRATCPKCGQKSEHTV